MITGEFGVSECYPLGSKAMEIPLKHKPQVPWANLTVRFGLDS